MLVSRFSNELVLVLAEHMDVVSLRNFMATNKRFHNLISAYERSISNTKASSHCYPPPIGGAVLSSATIERHVLRAGTLDLARELERRAERMNDILLRSAPAFLDLSSLPGLPPGPVSAPTSSGAANTSTSSSTGLVTLTPEQQGRLEPLLRQALCRCDQIADIAANSANCEPVSADMYDLIPTGYWASPGRHDNGGVPGGSGDGNGGGRDADAVDPFANPAIRPEQIEYIRALSPADVTALFYLVSVLSAAFARARGFHLDDHPDAHERVLVFEECVLRHGTWFAWSYARGEGELKEMTGHMMAAGRKELKHWETSPSEDLPDGLRMTLFRRFRELCFDSEDADAEGARNSDSDGDEHGTEEEEEQGGAAAHQANGGGDGVDVDEDDVEHDYADDDDDEDGDEDAGPEAGQMQRRRVEMHVYELVKDIVYGGEEAAAETIGAAEAYINDDGHTAHSEETR